MKCKKIRMSFLLAITMLGFVAGSSNLTMAFAATAVTASSSQLQDTSSSYTGDGTTENPYKIAVTGNAAGSGAFTSPSKFWGDGTKTNGVGNFAVSFEQFTGNTTDGKLISAMTFDLSKNATSIWDSSWTYAFRLPTWTLFDTSTGDLRMAFAYKGNFKFYFNDWTYEFDAVSATKDLETDKQLNVGDIVMLTYYGNYISGQTNKGTNYTTDFDATDTAATATYYAKVDQNGYAVFSGDNAIEYGGNYKVEKADFTVNAENSINTINTKSGQLQLIGAMNSTTLSTDSVTWEIIDGQDNASIDSNGLLTAMQDGQVTVRAYYTNYENLYTDFVVSISNQNNTDVIIDNTSDDEASSDTTVDTPSDTTVDTSSDTTVDTSSDTTVDTSSDTTVDTTSDVVTANTSDNETSNDTSDNTEVSEAPQTGDSTFPIQYVISFIIALACIIIILSYAKRKKEVN